MQAMAGPMLGMVRQLGGAMFGAQVGQGIGALAGEVVGSTDVGLPLGPAGKAVLLPANVRAFGEGLEVPADEVRLYLALRECGHQRLFAHVPWLRSRLFAAVEDYARGISIDTSRLEQTMGSLDPSNPQAIQEALQSGLFEPEDTPQQKAALARLETLLALVEGWVDAVVTGASGALPSAEAMRETVRRARATGGPAEQTFATLVGLELRPRRLREAAALWTELAAPRGVDGRDAVWAHPDLLPTAEDLNDPAGFVARTELGTSGFDLSELDSAGDAPEDPEKPGSGPDSE
jgi:putative hydrolase